MTPERDAAVLAVQSRLERAVASMPTPDVDAGWAALVAQLDGPIAPVLPLRRPSRARAVALAVAAAMMIAGAAFATVGHFGDPGVVHIAPAPPPPGLRVAGPHTHPAFSGPPAVETPHEATGDHPHPNDGSGSPTGPVGSVDGSGDGHGGGSSTNPGDDPNDRDQGTGNDGGHNDNGGGNDGREGSTSIGSSKH